MTQPKDPQEPLKPKDFFNSEWFKDGTKKLCSDGWPTFVVPLNIMVNKMLEENQALQSKLEKAEAEIKRLRNALEFYASKENWTITEDYNGYVVEGFIVEDDIEYPPKIPNTWNGYGWGGKRARQALKGEGE